MKVIEPATRSRFHPEGYLMVNPDVAAAIEQGGGDARLHFDLFGEAEGWRRQISAAFMIERPHYMRRKFVRFGRIVDEDLEITFLGEGGAFPIVLSDQHFTREDYAAESANGAYPPFVADITANPDKLYLDLGCGLREDVFDNCIYLDVYPSLTADVIVSPDCSYPFKSGTFDGIGCFAVLEHVTRPWGVAAEIHRMLKPGGKAYIAWPFLQPVHGFPSHYYNATREGLKFMFRDGFDLEYCRTELSDSPAFTMSWVLGKFVNSLPPGKKTQILGMSVGDLLAQPRSGPFWNGVLEGLPDDIVSEFACGNTLIATKRC